ncbi:hypothetical protein [Streptomyces sp. NPDC058861]|uniref:hypothetical protein n=1 Tax=Streptomyces sp. NPDC058861 TaxID=3346653 RepID=UPI0036AEE844
MRITIDTEAENYADAAARLRTAYAPPPPHSRAPAAYVGKFVLEPLPADIAPAGWALTSMTDERPKP